MSRADKDGFITRAEYDADQAEANREMLAKRAKSPSRLLPLTKEEAAAASEFISGEARMNRFIGWMLSAARNSTKVAEEISTFIEVIERRGK